MTQKNKTINWKLFAKYIIPFVFVIIGILVFFLFTIGVLDSEEPSHVVNITLFFLSFYILTEFVSRVIQLEEIDERTEKLQKTTEEGFRKLSEKPLDPSDPNVDLLQLLAFPYRAKVSESHLMGLTDMRTLFWDIDTTKKAEENAEIIWVATPQIYWEIDPEFSKIIHKRIQAADVRYYQLYLDNDENKDTLEFQVVPTYDRLNPNWRSFVKFVPLKRDQFPWYIEHVVYFRKENATPISNCILVNLIDSHASVDRNYNLELRASLRNAFMSQFTRIWNNNIDDNDWKLTNTFS